MANNGRSFLAHSKLLAELVLPVTTISSSTITILLHTEAKTLKAISFEMTKYEQRNLQIPVCELVEKHSIGPAAHKAIPGSSSCL
jgi:hypothetical protein